VERHALRRALRNVIPSPALQKALKADRPVVIDVVSDIDALAPVGVTE
jgi:hypothetical protein